MLTVALALRFSPLLPGTVSTWCQLRAILSAKSVIALLALAATIPMVTGKIDWTVDYGLALWHILAISDQRSAISDQPSAISGQPADA